MQAATLIVGDATEKDIDQMYVQRRIQTLKAKRVRARTTKARAKGRDNLEEKEKVERGQHIASKEGLTMEMDFMTSGEFGNNRRHSGQLGSHSGQPNLRRRMAQSHVLR